MWVCGCGGVGVYAPAGRARNEERQKELQPGDFRTLLDEGENFGPHLEIPFDWSHFFFFSLGCVIE